MRVFSSAKIWIELWPIQRVYSAHETQFSSLHIPQCKKNWVCASRAKYIIYIVPRVLIVSKKRRWRSLTIIISLRSSFGFLFLYIHSCVALMWARYLSDFFYFFGLSRQQESLLLEPICRHVSAADILSRNRQQHKTHSLAKYIFISTHRLIFLFAVWRFLMLVFSLLQELIENFAFPSQYSPKW